MATFACFVLHKCENELEISVLIQCTVDIRIHWVSNYFEFIYIRSYTKMSTILIFFYFDKSLITLQEVNQRLRQWHTDQQAKWWKLKRKQLRNLNVLVSNELPSWRLWTCNVNNSFWKCSKKSINTSILLHNFGNWWHACKCWCINHLS